MMISLYVRGTVISVPEGSVIQFAHPNAEQLIRVRVQGITFIISREMILATQRNTHHHPHVMPSNFFTSMLDYHATTNKTVSEIDLMGEDHALNQAKYYPLVFDLMCRLQLPCCAQAFHDFHMEPEDADGYNTLLEALCLTGDESLPLSGDGKSVYVAMVPNYYYGEPLHDVPADLCTNPKYVRLVMEAQTRPVNQPYCLAVFAEILDEFELSNFTFEPGASRQLVRYPECGRRL
jgi:hypothetical protein